MLESAHAELNPQIAAAIDALRAKSKKKIERAYLSYGSGHGKRTWHETVKHAGRLAEATEAEIATLIANAASVNVAPEAESDANNDEVITTTDDADATSDDGSSEPGEKIKRKRRKRMTAAADNQHNAGDGAAAPGGESGGSTTAPAEAPSVRSLHDEALLAANLHTSASRLLQELVASHRRAIHLAVTTGKLTNPPQPGDTKDRFKEGAHALFNLWMTRSLAAQDAALEKISLWEKSLTAFLHVQVQDLLFGVASSERERVVEPYDIVFRRVRTEKLRITALIQREHDTFQGTLQGALRKRIAAIEADTSIVSEKKKGRKAESGAEPEEEVEEELAAV